MTWTLPNYLSSRLHINLCLRTAPVIRPQCHQTSVSSDLCVTTFNVINSIVVAIVVQMLSYLPDLTSYELSRGHKNSKKWTTSVRKFSSKPKQMNELHQKRCTTYQYFQTFLTSQLYNECQELLLQMNELHQKRCIKHTAQTSVLVSL